MNAPLVSVIVPIYNAAQYLPGCVESVLKQSIGFESIQLILCDDCSTDGSFEIAQRYAAQHPANITALQLPCNSGSASAPRNMGLDAATAEHIMFLDADDMWTPDALQTVWNLMSVSDAELASAAYKRLGSKEKSDARYTGCREGEYDIRLQADEWFPIAHPIVTKLFRRSVIEENRIRFPEDLRNGEDSIFLFRYFLCIEKAVHTNAPIYEYRVREDSVSHAYNKRYFQGLSDACSTVENEFLSSDICRLAERFLEEITISCLDILCDCETLDEEERLQLLSVWYPHIKLIADRKLHTLAPIGESLGRDAARADYIAYEADFLSLAKLYTERRVTVRRFTSSRSWRIITKINALLGRG